MPNYRSRKLLNHARGKACIRCRREDGTTIPAHYSGMMSFKLGKGTGIKPHDLTADLCMACHHYFDMHEAASKEDSGLEFMMLVLATLKRRIDEGNVTVQDKVGVLYRLTDFAVSLVEALKDGELNVK